jgi:hypothetical protein
MTEQQTKMAVGLGTTTTTKDSKQADSTTTKPSKTTKLASILGLLVSGRSLNRFEAEHHHDHCLNTTISTLQNGHGIVIDRERETVPCMRGAASVSVNRYWLNTKPDNTQRAHDLLAKLERTT